MGVRVSWVKPSDCFRCLKKLSFTLPFLTFRFDTYTYLSSWWSETCWVIRQQFWMTECDILGGQNVLWTLLHIFRGCQDSQPQDLHRCVQCFCDNKHVTVHLYRQQTQSGSCCATGCIPTVHWKKSAFAWLGKRKIWFTSLFKVSGKMKIANNTGNDHWEF